MFEELILHIGMPKTGTTSIQRALNSARGGADWTYLDLNPPHSANPVILRAHGGISPVGTHPGPRGVQTSDAARAHLDNMLASVRTPRAILSAEVMVRLPPAAIANLLAHLSAHTRKITAIAYIRPPYSFVTSYTQQFYKTGYGPLADVIRRAQRPIPADISIWDHALGHGNVRLFPFVPDTFAEGSVVQHFAEVLALGPLVERSGNANVSLGGEGTRLLALFRRHNPARHPHDGRILHRLAKLGGQPFRLHPACLTDMAEMAEATRTWASDRMGWAISEVPPEADERSIRQDADFEDILLESLDWLAEKAGLPANHLYTDSLAIADAVRSLRDHPTGQSRIGRIAKRLRLA
ncbi:hypothetical protein [Gymnodinialimonas hymeniacidonis]|uniref:hypothetical protein n=1 Tax=Gymnodinialimonas hymeniacidonis TaxID=3126508 RepID=UPI0034C5EE76